MNLLNLYFLASWLPTVANQAGYGIGTSVLVGTMEQIAGMIGGFTLGFLVQRFGFGRVLTTCFAVACINIALIGLPGLSLAMLFMVVFLAGLRRCGRTNRRQCVVGHLLSDRFASHWNRRGTGHRTHRGNYRPGSWRRSDEPAFAIAKAVPGSRGPGVDFSHRDGGNALGAEGAEAVRTANYSRASCLIMKKITPSVDAQRNSTLTNLPAQEDRASGARKRLLQLSKQSQG